MNLQTLSIILIIIILPITLILSAYTKTQIDTLALQTNLRTQLKNATYDAVVAFQLNTVQNEFSTVSDSMRRDVSAAIQSFMTNLAGNMGMSGATENALKPYIPAIVFTMYDGYYIYSPSKSTIVDSNGNEKSTYEHVLKPYIYYTIRYVKNDTKNIDVIVNYSLDNYIVVTGTIDGKYITKAGYLEVITNDDSNNRIEYWDNPEANLERNLPVTTVVFKDNTENRSSVGNIGKFDTEVVKVNIANLKTYNGIDVTDRLSNGVLLTDSNVLRNPERLSINSIPRNENGTINLTEEIIKNKNSLMADTRYHKTNYMIGGVTLPEWYAVEGDYNVGFYVEPSVNPYYVSAESAEQYYNGNEENEGALKFTEWVVNNLGTLTPNDAVRAYEKRYKQEDGTLVIETKYKEFENKTEKIFAISPSNNPEDPGSAFNDHREEVIKASIKDNLGQALASYSEKSEALGPTSSFQLPFLTDEEWHKILTNVCFITFMQGIQVGTKMFNDYCIVTSTRNKEYVSPDSIYYINEGGDGYYHKLGCKHLVEDKPIVGYRNSEFDRKYYEKKFKKADNDYDDKRYYYYMHSYDGEDGQEHVYEACYYCMVTKADNVMEDWTKSPVKRKAYYTSMAREKFNFYKTNSYFKTKTTE